MSEYRKFLSEKVSGLLRLQCLFVAIFPAIAMNILISLHCVLINRNAKSAMYSLLKSRHANLVTRFAANILHVGN